MTTRGEGEGQGEEGGLGGRVRDRGGELEDRDRWPEVRARAGGEVIRGKAELEAAAERLLEDMMEAAVTGLSCSSTEDTVSEAGGDTEDAEAGPEPRRCEAGDTETEDTEEAPGMTELTPEAAPRITAAAL